MLNRFIDWLVNTRLCNYIAVLGYSIRDRQARDLIKSMECEDSTCGVPAKSTHD